jgi:hypothetical protein
MNPLQALAPKVATDPFFLAAVLADYARSESLDDAGLCAALGCRAEDLPMLRLCRAPRAEAKGFREDIADIAGRFGLEASRLTSVVRQGQAVGRLRQVAEAAPEPGLLLAARDAPPPSSEPES